MLSKFSVKKPYTVMVAVVLVIILGVVSFTNMTADLLPDMNLPYAIVMTTYPGASPEEVETVVTKPVEQAMATVSNIENIQSVSQENVSMVILEFNQTTNMDSVSLEMRENLDQIKSYWDDSIGNPIIMKLNPDMMPVMVAAVEQEGLDSIGITDLVENELLSELESLEGVASVSTSGEVEESVQVIIRQEKIDSMNEKIAEAMGVSFADARKELDDAEKELEDAQEELDNGKSQMESGQQEMIGKLSQASGAEAQILQGEAQISQAEKQLDAAERELKAQRSELEAQINFLKAGTPIKDENYTKAYDEAYAAALAQAKEQAYQAALEEAKKTAYQTALDTAVDQAYNTALSEAMKAVDDSVEEQLAPFMEQKEQLEQKIRDYVAAGGDEEEIAKLEEQLASVNQQIDLVKTVVKKNLQDVAKDEVDAKRGEIEAAVQEQIDANKAQIEQAAVEGVDANRAQVDAAAKAELDKAFPAEFNKNYCASAIEIMQGYLTQMDDAQAQIDAGRAQLDSTKQQLSQGKITLAQAQTQIEGAKISATIQMATAAAQLSAGQAQIDAGKEQLKEGKEQIDEAEEEALDGADLNGMLTIDTVSQILTAQNFNMPAGYVTEDNIQYLVRVGDKFEDTEDIENLVLFDMGLEGLDPIRLRDVADVVISNNSDLVYARVNGNPAVVFSMQKQTGYSTGEVSDRIKERFETLQETYDGLHMTILMDQGVYIDMVIDSVLSNLLSGAVLAIIILFFFLKDIRPTGIVACSIPISVIGAIALMYFSGISLNIISLSGLAFGVGMLVDNSIVVIENIYRLRSLGIPVKKAAVQGAKQVAGAIVASTLTTVCVFLPIVFTEGITRQLFVDMGLTIGYSLLASLIVALTVVPALATGVMKTQKEHKTGFLDRVTAVYGRVMGVLLRKKFLVIGASIVLLVISAALAMRNGTAFLPDMESTQTSISVTMPEGSTTAETGEMTDEIMERLSDIEDIEDIGAMTGNGSSLMGLGGGSSDGMDNSSTIYLILKEDKELTGAQLKDAILERTEDLDCEVSVTTEMMDMSALGGSGISIQVKGKELDTLQEIAADVAGILENVEGLEEISDGMEEATQELRLVVDKDKASEHNLTVAQIYMEIQKQLADTSTSTTLSTETKDYEVDVVDEEQKSFTREDIKGLTIEATNQEGETEEIPLEDLVSFEDANGPDSISRMNQTRYLTVSAAVKDDYNVGLVGNEVSDALKDYEVPEGYELEMAGEDETISEAMTEMLKMLGLAIVFIYLIMVAQFQSLLSPFIVMFTIPLAFTGGFLGLVLTGSEVSIIAMLGFIMLSGIIVNNGIVLVDYTNQLRAGGMEKRAALIEAGKTRLRPILMTALTTILGLSTMAMGMGMGADMIQPMAVVAIGGLLYGTLLTLLVVPCIYDLLNRKEYHSVSDEELEMEEIPETVSAE